jgi:hypothetical protein
MQTEMNASPITDDIRPFQDRIGEAVCGGGFRIQNYWVWGASVARGEDGRYHMFASRWPKTYPFFQGYTAASEIVRATSDTPEGPFELQEVVLGPRDPGYWDGRMAHNPCLFRTSEGWFLFYCGVTYREDVAPGDMWDLNRHPDGGKNGMAPGWMLDMRSGVAFSRSLPGPWERPDAPLDLGALSRRNHERAVNVTAVETFDGRCRIYYRITGTGLITAVAGHPAGPYPVEEMEIVSDYASHSHTEDPFAFRIGNHYEILTKDSTGEFTGEQFALIHNVSTDGRRWAPAPEPKACSRRVRWTDGKVREQGNLERPFVLLEDGRPAYLYAATSDGTHTHEHPAHYNAENTWNMVIPLT